MKSPIKLDYKTVSKVKLVIVMEHVWTVELFSQIPPTLGKEVDTIVVGDRPLKAGSKLGCMAVIAVLSKIMGQPFCRVDAADEKIYYARADCSFEETNELRKVNKLVKKISAKQKKLRALMKRNRLPYCTKK